MNIESHALPLPELALIHIEGDDATAFLQAQLTNDMSHADESRAVLAGYCSPKGRLLATMILWRPPQPAQAAWCMLTSASLADALIQRLSIFILRSKVRLSRSSGAVLGRSAPDASSALPPWSLQHHGGETRIAAPRDTHGPQRWWVIPADGTMPESAAATASPEGAQWQAADIAAGLPWVHAATQDLFLPQILNLDLIQGLSFEKGCYPGQEVVARLHYRGSVRRRMMRGRIDPVPGGDGQLEGTDVYDAGKPASPCGRVVNAAASDGLHLLFEAPLAGRHDAEFRLGTPEGPRIELLPLPYALD